MQHEKVNLRGKRAIVFHPDDEEANELGRQLLRIGLRVEQIWDNPRKESKKTEFVFALLSRKVRYEDIAAAPFMKSNTVCVLIIESETPMVLQEVFAWDAIITKPFRPFGLLAQLVHASQRQQQKGVLEKRVRVLSRKVDGFKQVEHAKEFLMESYRMTGGEAFEVLRSNAMKQRKTIEEVANEVNRAKSVIGSIESKEGGGKVSILDPRRKPDC